MKDDNLKITSAGLKELEDELENRKTVVRREIADDIERARQQGDLSENAAYKSALESKEFNENRISKLEDTISTAEVITKSSGSTIGIGNKVKITNLNSKTKDEYAIVGASEANPIEKKISISSPIGAALRGKKAGDTVKVELPTGTIEFKIDKVN